VDGANLVPELGVDHGTLREWSLSRRIETIGDTSRTRHIARTECTTWFAVVNRNASSPSSSSPELASVQRSLYGCCRGASRDLEKAESARLGSTSKASGRNHCVWAHPRREFELYIPQYDLIPDAVGQRILDDAGE